MMAKIRPFLPMIMAGLTTVFGYFATPIQGAVAANPDVSIILGGLAVMLGMVLKSPIAKK